MKLLLQITLSTLFIFAASLASAHGVHGDHGGHGSAPVKIVKQALGVYFVSEAYFVMPGRWNVRFFVDRERADLIVDVKP